MRVMLLPMTALALGAGCSGEPRANGPITVVFKHARMFGDDPVPRLVAAFEAKHPGVRVKTEALGAASDEQHQSRCSSAPSTRSAPST